MELKIKKIKTTLKISRRSKHKIQFDMYIMIKEFELLILLTSKILPESFSRRRVLIIYTCTVYSDFSHVTNLLKRGNYVAFLI